MIDARIPLGIEQFSLADIMQQAEQLKASRQQREYRQFEMDSRKQEMESRKTLSGLIGPALKGDTQAKEQILQVGSDDSFKWYLDLDQRGRAAEKAKVEDAMVALRWADTADKWPKVQAYYQGQGIDAASIPFERREELALQLGGLKQYMDSAPKMELKTTEPGGGLYGVDPRTGATKVLVTPNTGGGDFGQPAIQEGATATNPQTGEKVIYRNGQWQRAGGGAGNGASNFQR